MYDAERTAELFCRVVNRWKTLSDAYDGPASSVPAGDGMAEAAAAVEAAAPDTGPLPG